ncbi:MAG: nucleotidyltransferase family protein, partial [Candidatus Dormibacteraeota bacterium]|nr:nucleotidyltransferase family protein [Candidatus Dormibacteraeota bacterium]
MVRLRPPGRRLHSRAAAPGPGRIQPGLPVRGRRRPGAAGRGRPLTPGERLVALTARLAPRPANLQSALAAAPDWPDTLCLLGHHRLLARAHDCLKPWKQQVPAPAWRTLAQAAADYWRTGAVVAQGSRSVLPALDDAGVAAVPLKGPWLAERLGYPAGTRLTNDLDILVRPVDLAAARSVLSELGYRQLPEPVGLPGAHLVYVPGRPDLWLPQVEVHYNLAEPDGGAWSDRAWRRLHSRRWGDRAVLDLAAVDLVLYLSVHAARHNWFHLCHILELAYAVQAVGPKLDWAALWREASLAGLSGALRLSLSVAGRMCGAPLPDGWWRGRPAGRSLRAGLGDLMLRRRGLVRPRPELRDGPYFTLLLAVVDDGLGRALHRLGAAARPPAAGENGAGQART